MSAYIPPITHNGDLNTTFNSQDFESTYLDTFLPITGGTITGALQITGGLDNTGVISTTSLNATGGITSGDLHTSGQKIHLGVDAGLTNQGTASVAVGYESAKTDQGNYAVAMGRQSGEITQGEASVAIGNFAGNDTQGINCVAVGRNAGRDNQGEYGVAIGFDAGTLNALSSSIAIGKNAGEQDLAEDSICIGSDTISKGTNSISIGNSASTSTFTGAVAIGNGTTATENNQIKIGNSSSTYDMEGRLNLVNTTSPLSSMITYGSAIKLYRFENGLTIGNYDSFAVNVADTTAEPTSVPASRGGINALYINNEGRIYLGNSTNTMSAHIRSANGETYITGYTTAGNVSTIGTSGQLSVSSDRRLKENIITYDEPSIEKIMKIKSSYYNWISDKSKKKELGFIAQEVEDIIPEAVDGKKYEYEWEKDEDGEPILDASGNLQFTDIPRYRGFSDRPLIAVLVKAVQEQQEQIEALKTEMEDLKKLA
jgi:hypothetical protein